MEAEIHLGATIITQVREDSHSDLMMALEVMRSALNFEGKVNGYLLTDGMCGEREREK